MIRPASFRSNEQTASSNHYQQGALLSPEEIMDHALAEFDAMVSRLREEGIHVMVFEDDPEADTPDALFPNNWVSFHADGRIALYPMQAPNRRLERREDILADLEFVHGFAVTEIVDFSEFEEHDKFLEGTGSMVLDRVHQRAYAARSPRTDRDALEAFCEAFDFEGILFSANQTVENKREPIYHTNVMMSIGTRFAAICLDCIDDLDEREMVLRSLQADGKTVVDLREDQIAHFAGNMLELQDGNGDACIVMSEAAFRCLDEVQREVLSAFGRLIYMPLDVIEACGGGSARCMLAEVHLPFDSHSH